MTGTVHPSDNSRLADLLLDPREALDVEIKGWLDLAGSEEHKATLAKAILALANHGGGYIILGFDETDTGVAPASKRPVTLDCYSQDAINAIVQNYAEPPFHCSVHHVAHPMSGVHPVIGVPGGHRVPIRAKRAGPNNQVVQQHAVYTRRPGPKSEQPLSARDWDELFARCLDARRDELLDRIRDLLTGKPSADNSVGLPRLDQWAADSLNIWQKRLETLPADSPSRCPHGFFTFAYIFDSVKRLGFAQLRDVLRDAPSLTGWNVWWVPTRHAISPSIVDGAIECWLGGDTSEHQDTRDASHSDFWRVSPDGFAFLLRGYQEDGEHAARAGIKPGTVIDVTLPIWRVGEALLHAAYLGSRLDASAVSFSARYTGLSERRLTQWTDPMSYAWAAGTSKEDTVAGSAHVSLEEIGANLVEIVQSVLSPFYERFDFTRLPAEVVQHELNKLRKRAA